MRQARARRAPRLAPLQDGGVDAARRLVDEAAHRRVDQLFEHALQPRTVDRRDHLRLGLWPSRAASRRRRRRRPGRAGSPGGRGRRAPARSRPPRSPPGPPRGGSCRAPPSPRRAAAPPSSRPRQPQPTISARATALAYVASKRPARAQPLELLFGDLVAQLLLGASRRRRGGGASRSGPPASGGTSSISFWASTSGERVGFQSSEVGAAAGVEVADHEAARRP